MRGMKIYSDTYKPNQKQWKTFPAMWNLQTNTYFNWISKKWTDMQEARGQSKAPNTTRPIRCFCIWEKREIF